MPSLGAATRLLSFSAAAALWASTSFAQSADPVTSAPAPTPAAPGTPAAPARTRLLPAETTPAPAAPSAPAVDPTATTPTAIDPARDERRLVQQGADRPAPDGSVPSSPTDVFSEDWWGRARPIFEIHGYFRTRSELLHNFAMNRHDPPGGTPDYPNQNLWPHPLDFSYADATRDRPVSLCGAEVGNRCQNRSQASANMRLRIAPELHISDNLRVMTQIDALDNLVLGSTPDSYAMQPNQPTGAAPTTPTGYAPAGRGYYPYAPITFFSNTQGPPTAGINSFRNSIDVKRAWAEYATPLGQVRFGRMPFHWGLGMLYNAGDGVDSDWQTTMDRIMFASGIKSADLYFGGSWDFVSSGVTNGNAYEAYGGQYHNLANLVNVGQWMLFVSRKKNPEMQRLALSRGEFVLNGGLVSQLRLQYLDIRPGTNPYAIDYTVPDRNNGLVGRGAIMLSPDVWVQAMWKKFRFEAEFAMHYGQMEQTPESQDPTNPVKIRQYGLATQTEFLAVDDKLHLNFGFGWASGDQNAETLNPGSGGWTRELNNGRGPISTFRFHPDYRVDLIFWRRMMTRVQGAYYFRPSVDYDFIKNLNGQRFGGGAAIIWSRASEFTQTPGHKRDLGVELNLRVYYQAKDGSLNDDPKKMGGFFAMLEYGVFFPMGGLGYLPGQIRTTPLIPTAGDWDTSAAQTLRLFVGVTY